VIEALAYYGYTEVDTNVPVTGGFLESTINYNTSGVNLSGIAGVTVYFPSGAPRNSNATKYYIYRVDVSGTPPQDFTKVGEAQITSSGWVDDFTVPIGNASSTPYGMVRVVDSYYDRDVPPPAFIHINEYKGSHVALSDSYPRRLYYTPPGRRESYPVPYRIESFPMAKHDELRGTISLGDTMLILAIGGVMTIDELPIANQEGILGVESNVRKIDGQPGCVGYRSFVPYSVNGAPRGAWVSRFGVQITTGATVARISDDLDWKATVNIDTLETSILFWDEDRQMLVLYFDQDGDSVNDHMLFFHMAPEHTKGSESRPKITGPHPVKCKGLTTAEVGGIPCIFTANTTDGSVYVEWNGNADASNAYTASGIVSLFVKSGKIYSKDYREWSAFKGLVRHDHWGNADVLGVTWHYGRDLHHRVSSVTKSIGLSGVQADHFFVGRQGDWAQLELTHEGSGLGAITAIQVVTNMGGELP
jgi:hypothetical protein